MACLHISVLRKASISIGKRNIISITRPSEYTQISDTNVLISSNPAILFAVVNLISKFAGEYAAGGGIIAYRLAERQQARQPGRRW